MLKTLLQKNISQYRKFSENYNIALSSNQVSGTAPAGSHDVTDRTSVFLRLFEYYNIWYLSTYLGFRCDLGKQINIIIYYLLIFDFRYLPYF